jgi:hypothetical protein
MYSGSFQRLSRAAVGVIAAAFILSSIASPAFSQTTNTGTGTGTGNSGHLNSGGNNGNGVGNTGPGNQGHGPNTGSGNAAGPKSPH